MCLPVAAAQVAGTKQGVRAGHRARNWLSPLSCFSLEQLICWLAGAGLQGPSRRKLQEGAARSRWDAVEAAEADSPYPRLWSLKGRVVSLRRATPCTADRIRHRALRVSGVRRLGGWTSVDRGHNAGARQRGSMATARGPSKAVHTFERALEDQPKCALTSPRSTLPTR